MPSSATSPRKLTIVAQKNRLNSVVLTLTLSLTAPCIQQILLLPLNSAQLWLATDFRIIQQTLNLIKMQ